MIVISDANVIVYFWKAGLFEKLHTSVKIQIPEKIFIELTQNRIKSSYPDLSEKINEHRYNHQLENRISVLIIEHEEEETLEVHEFIKEESGLDDGEIDGIMLSILSGVVFVTNDSDAIEFSTEGLDRSLGSQAQNYEDFLDELENNNIIDSKEKAILIKVKED